MKVQLRFLSGARAGQVEVYSKAYIGLGRHPLSDARFDADRDLDVSARHAAIVHRGDQFILRDLGSKNGTRLNGKPVTGDTVLTDGAVIGFGANGPTVEFHVLEAGTADVSAGARASAQRMSSPRDQIPAASAPARHASPPQSAPPPRSSTALRIAAEVQRQTLALRRTTKGLVAFLLVIAFGFGWMQWSSTRRAHEMAELQLRADSLNRVAQQLVSRFRTELESVREALRESQSETATLRNDLAVAGASGDRAAVSLLRDRLDSAAMRQRGLTEAAGVDYRAIAHNNVDAVALVIVKFSDREIYSGTAFAVDSQGTLVTNKHVLTGIPGAREERQPIGIAVKFSGSKQWFQGHVAGISDAADIAVLKVDLRGGTPRVLGIAPRGSSLERGDPVAIIGYPLGEDLPMDRQSRAAIADPTLTVGTVSKVLSAIVQLDGYGAPGSSGSPVFDRDGRVVAVVYGGQRESQGKIVYAVPAQAVSDLLRTLHISD